MDRRLPDASEFKVVSMGGHGEGQGSILCVVLSERKGCAERDGGVDAAH